MLEAKLKTGRVECGTDEDGRGCLAGPVTAAAIILPDDFKHPLLNDSKALTEKQRLIIEPILKEEAISYAVTHIGNDKIDKINILQASVLAMHRAIEKLDMTPEFIAVDGNYFKEYPKIEHKCIVKGDARYLHIAAASILAKNARDRFMASLDKEYPAYGWKTNKGYPTKAHRQAIAKIGPSPYHRTSFKLLPDN